MTLPPSRPGPGSPAGPTRIDELFARTRHLHRPWLVAELLRAPGIYRPQVAGRATHKYAALQR